MKYAPSSQWRDVWHWLKWCLVWSSWLLSVSLCFFRGSILSAENSEPSNVPFLWAWGWSEYSFAYMIFFFSPRLDLLTVKRNWLTDLLFFLRALFSSSLSGLDPSFLPSLLLFTLSSFRSFLFLLIVFLLIVHLSPHIARPCRRVGPPPKKKKKINKEISKKKFF